MTLMSVCTPCIYCPRLCCYLYPYFCHLTIIRHWDNCKIGRLCKYENYVYYAKQADYAKYVDYAKYADQAKYADYAKHADYVKFAKYAEYTKYVDYAKYADYTKYAGYAKFADYAKYAKIAKHWSFMHSAFCMEISQCTSFSVLRVEVLQFSKRIFEGFELVLLKTAGEFFLCVAGLEYSEILPTFCEVEQYFQLPPEKQNLD